MAALSSLAVHQQVETTRQSILPWCPYFPWHRGKEIGLSEKPLRHSGPMVGETLIFFPSQVPSVNPASSREPNEFLLPLAQLPLSNGGKAVLYGIV